MKFRIIALLLLTLTFFTACKQGVDRSQLPKDGPTPEIKIGRAEKFTLLNGLQVIMVENHKLPKVSASLLIDNKPELEKDKVGVSSIMGSLLGKGTNDVTEDEFNEQVDFMGAEVSFNSGGAGMSSLNRYFDETLRLMADGIKNPVFTEEELNFQKQLVVERLMSHEKNAEEILDRVKDNLLFGNNHPYGEFLTKESVDRITLKDIQDNHNTYFRPNNAYLAIVGDIDIDETKQLVSDLFTDWEQGDIPKANWANPTNVESTQIDFVDVPSSAQSQIAVVNNIELKLGDKDLYATLLANNILGGGMSGRLFKNLREDKAYTYGAYSSVNIDKYGSYFVVSSSVRNQVTDSAIVEFKKELETIRQKPVTEEELKIAKASYTGNFVMTVQKPETVADFALNTARYNLPNDFYSNYIKNINAVTVEDIQKVAQKYFDLDHARIVVIGKGSDVAKGLDNTGYSVKYYDTYANEIEKPKTEDVPTDVTAETVIDNYFKAIGGYDNINKVKTIMIVSKGSIQGAEMINTLKLKAPNKTASITEIKAMGTQKQVYNGTKAYMEMQGRKQYMEGNDLKQYEDFVAPFDEVNLKKGALKGIETVEGKKAYVVKYKDRTVFFDVESGLKVKESSMMEDDQGAFEVNTYYSDYKSVDGIKTAHTIKQNMGDGVDIEFKVTEVKINKGVSDSDFE